MAELREAHRAGSDGESEDAAGGPGLDSGRFRDTRIAQLTSRRAAEENAETFLRLANPREDDKHRQRID